MRDLCVVGGGPVGLVTALYAVRAGLSVTVLEPRGTPIDKACGEGLMPAGLDALHALGVDPPGWPVRGIRYVRGGRSVTADFQGGIARGIRRTELHTHLALAARAAGVEIVSARATAFEQDGARVQVVVAGPGDQPPVPPLLARYVVAADGLHSSARRALGVQARARGPRRMGLRQHLTLAHGLDHVEVHWGRSAELYLTPVAADLLGVAVLSRIRQPLAVHLEDFPAVRERLARGVPVGAIRGAGPLRQASTRRVVGRCLLVGDAAGYVDALTGEGLSVGFAQAGAAIEAILANDPRAYERGWRRATRRADLLTATLLTATRANWVRSSIVPAARTFPGVFGRIVELIGAPATPAAASELGGPRTAGAPDRTRR
ncbi:MAG: NAD(P)/FAD-dependent oxidoreductase [Nostocoides sp.]|nr:NAD(P)/FAD-dependent oxidoreductase [Tetrasphaera sp.]